MFLNLKTQNMIFYWQIQLNTQISTRQFPKGKWFWTQRPHSFQHYWKRPKCTRLTISSSQRFILRQTYFLYKRTNNETDTSILNVRQIHHKQEGEAGKLLYWDEKMTIEKIMKSCFWFHSIFFPYLTLRWC